MFSKMCSKANIDHILFKKFNLKGVLCKKTTWKIYPCTDFKKLIIQKSF